MGRQANAFQQFQPFLARSGFIALKHFDLRQRQVLNDRQMREQFKMLEHHPDENSWARLVFYRSRCR
jgi:hypothetical protein